MNIRNCLTSFAEYNTTLKYPDLPLVDVGGQISNLLPPEVCIILEKQVFRGKVPDELTSGMLAVACQFPNANGDAIVNRGLMELGLAQSPPPINSFGISVGSDMAVVPGRILPAPAVCYSGGTEGTIDTVRASWNMRGVRFAVGARLERWAVLLIRDGNPRDEFAGPGDPVLHQTVRGFADMCGRSGMIVDPQWMEPPITAATLPPRTPEDPLRKGAIACIRAALLGLTPKPRIMLVVLSNGDRHIYAGLKHLCDVYLNVATVCVHASKFRKEKGQLQYFANVALKFNVKLGGLNHLLSPGNMAWLDAAPTMLVGMDVTHPGVGAVPGTPSIAAVVASIDRKIGQFPASMRLQEPRKEVRVYHMRVFNCLSPYRWSPN